MHELFPKLMLSVSKEVKDQENIRYTDTCLDEIKGKINGPVVVERQLNMARTMTSEIATSITTN